MRESGRRCGERNDASGIRRLALGHRLCLTFIGNDISIRYSFTPRRLGPSRYSKTVPRTNWRSRDNAVVNRYCTNAREVNAREWTGIKTADTHRESPRASLFHFFFFLWTSLALDAIIINLPLSPKRNFASDRLNVFATFSIPVRN